MNLKGTRIAKPTGPASLILEPSRTEVWETLNCTRNPNLLVKYLASDGVSTLIKECEIIMSPFGWTGMIDLMDISAGSGVGAVQQFKIISDGGDYWNCHTWDGTTEGSIVYFVMKPHELRCGALAIASETVAGVTYDYTYTAVVVSGVTVSYTRDVTVSGTIIETDEIDPNPINKPIIYAMSCDNMIPSGYSTTVLLVDINNGARAWTKA